MTSTMLLIAGGVLIVAAAVLVARQELALRRMRREASELARTRFAYDASGKRRPAPYIPPSEDAGNWPHGAGR